MKKFDFDKFADKLSSVGKVIGFVSICISVLYRLNTTFGIYEAYKKKIAENKAKKEALKKETSKQEVVK